MDFFCGPAVLHLDGEEFTVYAYIDSAHDRQIEDWGGFIEIEVSDLLGFRAFGSDNVFLRIAGASARDIEITFTGTDGMAFAGLASSPLPVSAE